MTVAPSASLAEPLCGFILELFDMHDRNNFLRRRAVLVILQEIMGGTIERCGRAPRWRGACVSLRMCV
jgi:hypothetical protein